ncbi:carbohydrate sulfotransferase 1 isoform X2 [Xiphias gladius]|uniref:carbohydrate sulfotransferase 1 isoform X2 n=1 Tax=Xiphias gladius TaxID=8245 RepID=UPI001A9830A6|nr:carbohydrate sulfotransferase 1 isoform X2 [Xiphias gladius]
MREGCRTREGAGMECSWKTVLLLVCASLGVQYTAIRTLRDSLSGPCQGAYRCQTRHHRDSRWRAFCEDSWMPVESPRKHILLFATTRSGSSFTGQLLNQHPGIFYVFEPLYHVQQAFTNSSSRLRRTLDRRALLGAYRDLLLNLYTCDLHFMENYIRPEPQDHVTSSFFRRSSSHALCSPPVCLEGGGSDPPDETWCPKKCGALNLTLASMSCLSRGHIAIKTVRVPEVGDLRTLTEDPRLDLKIIHLVRDPRAILASRMMAFSDQFRAWKIWNATGRQPRYVDLSQITSTCKDIVASAETGLQKPAWLRGRYLLVRYEDLAFNPKDKATDIYRFVGLKMEDSVQMWIAKNTNSNVSSLSDWNYRYSTTRDSRATAESWRLRLSFEIVRTVQNLCNDTLALLGYKQVHSAAELRNLSHSLVEHRTF